MLYPTSMVSYQFVESTTCVLATGEKMDIRFYRCSMISFLDLRIDHSIIILMDKSTMRWTRL